MLHLFPTVGHPPDVTNARPTLLLVLRPRIDKSKKLLRGNSPSPWPISVHLLRLGVAKDLKEAKKILIIELLPGAESEAIQFQDRDFIIVEPDECIVCEYVVAVSSRGTI